MEVLGAVASSIAMIQALAAGKHVVSLIREMPDIQKDFEYMMKELGLIRSMVQAVRSMSPTDFEQDLIDNACGNLEEVTKQLEALLRKCAYETDQGDKKVWKTKKRKWLLDRSDIHKLQQRMGQAKETLHFAVTSSQTSLNSQLHTEVRQMHTTLYMMNMQICSTIETPQADPSSDQLSQSPQVLTSNERISNGTKVPVLEDELVQIQAVASTRKTAQTASCQCRCHFSWSQYRNSGWTQSVLGSWLVRCNRMPKQECSDPTCLCIGSTSLKLEYQVPKWLLLKTFRVFASYSSIAGISCSLRPVRLLTSDSLIWPILKGSRQAVQKAVVTYGIHPHDADSSGEGVLEYSIRCELYSSVEFLLDMWKSILAESGLPRRVAATANHLLRHADLDGHQTYLTQRVLSYARDDSEGVTTKVHAAIKKRAGLDEALREQPWAINTVDESGFSPLQLAILEGQVPVMEVLISAGANVEQQMYDGISVLRLAALSGNPEAVTVLLKAKCSANVADREGGTALYSAVAGGNEEVIRLLLMAGASATHRSAWGSTPLHRLGQSMQANCDVIKSTIDMLVMAGADLEAKDEVGDTPIACAIRGDNVRAVRCLVEAGSSLSSYGFYSQNLLHCASAFASLDMLECLCGLGLSDISPYQKDYRGFTPWDIFIFTHVANEWQLRGHRKPTPAEQMAFVELFQGVRDRYLQHDICILEHILSAMRKQDVTAAREGLALLIGRETNWECHDRASWYRAVDKRVQHMEWDLAMEDVEDFLVDMKKELDTPVWKFPSFWGAYLWGEDDEGWITEEESVESDWSSEEDLMEDEVPAAQDQDG